MANLFDKNDLHESLADSGANVYGSSGVGRRRKQKNSSIPLVPESFR